MHADRLGSHDVALTMVIPCYNEAHRFASAGWRLILQQSSIRLLFVNDGSQDNTADFVQQLMADAPDQCKLLSLPYRQGRSEAVRRGLLQAYQEKTTWIGYLDADLSCPPTEILRIYRHILPYGPWIVSTNRYGLPKQEQLRRGYRALGGRLFAAVARYWLGLPLQDGQSACKFFRRWPALYEALLVPFHNPWTFDVELLLRLLPRLPPAHNQPGLWEVPLSHWQDQPQGHFALPAMLRSLWDLRYLPPLPEGCKSRVISVESAWDTCCQGKGLD